MARIPGSTRSKRTDKILIMGLAESGKSTIVQVALEGRQPPPKDARYDATLEYARKTIVQGGEKLTIFDVGGQKAFLDRFTGELAEFIFTDVRSLIWVVDLTKLEELTRSKFYFDKCLTNLAQFSPDAQISVFLHKIDLIAEEVDYYEFAIQSALLSNVDLPIKLYMTSIYDNSIFNAVGAVLGSLELTTEAMESLIVSFHAKTSARSVEVISLKGGPVTRVGEPEQGSIVFERLGPRLIDFFTAAASGESQEELTGAIVETELGMMIWRKIDEDLFLTATFPKSTALLEVYPSVSSLISRLGASTSKESKSAS